MKKLLLALLLLFGSTSLFAEKIDKYSVAITIEPSGELSVVEEIDYNFEGLGKHGIFRDIPYQIKRNGIIKDIGLHNFSVSMNGGPVEWIKESYNSGHAGKVVRLKIGSPSLYLTSYCLMY